MTGAVNVESAVSYLQPWVDAGVLGALEVHAAAIIAGVLGDGDDDRAVVEAFALALGAPRHGHACIDVRSVADISAGQRAIDRADDDGDAVPVGTLPWPDPAHWLATLSTSSAVRVVSAVDAEPHLDDRPAVLHGSRLYTQRQWVDECAVAHALRRRAGDTGRPGASELLDRLLPPDVGGAVNHQHAAAAHALGSSLTVIAGGPGTGKTHTVACLLAAELDADEQVRIGLAAPTGKAASRMSEAIAAVADSGQARGDLTPDLAGRLRRLEALTVHRLLGSRPDHRSRFRHDRRNPLPYDVLVVDESSMLSLPLAARLLDAVADDCRLVFVGDPDQLNSIEVGAVLADVALAAASPGSPLGRCLVRLARQHRTAEESPIVPLAEAVRTGDADAALDLMRAGGDDRLQFVELPDGAIPDSAESRVQEVAGPAFALAAEAARAGDLQLAFRAVGTARILCAHRRGPYGAETWNGCASSWLDEHRRSRRDRAGRALLATRNDPRTGIANGDPGVLVDIGGTERAVFRRGGRLVDFAVAELDAVDAAYAMTVHKSQGSEYNSVVLIHPPVDSPLVGRELLYTAVTRASSRLLVVGSAESIRRAVETPVRRVTGLADALR